MRPQFGTAQAARFTVLGSGSAGNASLLEVEGFGLLIDCGLGPRILAERLAAVGLSWQAVSACLVSHTHRDHWNALTLAHLHRLRIPLLAHPYHHTAMSVRGEYPPLERAGLVRRYEEGQQFDAAPGLTCLPVRVPHDSEPTFAFRIEGTGWALGFASDVGHVTTGLLAAFSGVDALAIEFNHDERMQRASGRPPLLINRVLGDNGHLSNAQAADLTRAVARSGDLRHLIQLHLSRDCNRPDLAARAGRVALDRVAPDAVVTTATQFHPTTPLVLTPRAANRPRPARLPVGQRRSVQPSLPGLGDTTGPG
ncbi:MAG TPA: MBL fold metallo-hydrolase [Fimbriiglobus sp.]|nr:MBL fold metallo-hydrolase [Fimbriiglobus sp.]